MGGVWFTCHRPDWIRHSVFFIYSITKTSQFYKELTQPYKVQLTTRGGCWAQTSCVHVPCTSQTELWLLFPEKSSSSPSALHLWTRDGQSCSHWGPLRFWGLTVSGVCRFGPGHRSRCGQDRPAHTGTGTEWPLYRWLLLQQQNNCWEVFPFKKKKKDLVFLHVLRSSPWLVDTVGEAMSVVRDLTSMAKNKDQRSHGDLARKLCKN